MNKITEIVADHLKDSEFTDFFNRNYFPEEADFIKKFDHLIEFYSFYSQLAPYALYECSENECLPEAIVKEIVNEIDWDEVRETWADYNRC